jgi:hypothetical protein
MYDDTDWDEVDDLNFLKINWNFKNVEKLHSSGSGKWYPSYESKG